MKKSAFFLLSILALASGCSSTKKESTESSATVTDTTSTMSTDSTTMSSDSASTMSSDTTKKDSIK